MFILDSLLIGGLRFVFDKIAAAAESELNDDGTLRERLLEAQMRLELGEISDEEFAQTERAVLERLRELKGDPTGGLSLTSPGVKVVGVEATVADELNES